jgi:hypothetical protein
MEIAPTLRGILGKRHLHVVSQVNHRQILRIFQAVSVRQNTPVLPDRLDLGRPSVQTVFVCIMETAR